MAHPHIPVLLMAMVTSPGFKSLPSCTESREGSASATQRSCSGFVKTPMLGFDAVVVVVEDIVTQLKELTGELKCVQRSLTNLRKKYRYRYEG